MSLLYIAGHGNHEIGTEQQDPKIKIPEGLTVSFYADDDHAVGQLIGYRIAQLGGMDALGKNTYPSGEEITNYEINKLELAEYLNYRTTASAEFHGMVEYVGYGPVKSPIFLCSTPEAQTCRAGAHNCDGLLGSNGPIAPGTTDLRLIICRTPTIGHKIITSQVTKITETLPGEQVVQDEFPIETVTGAEGEFTAGKVVTSGPVGPYVNAQRAKQEQWLEWIKADPEKAVTDFEALREKQPDEQGIMLENVYLREALYSHYGTKFIEEHGPFAFYRYVESLPAQMKGEFLTTRTPSNPAFDAHASVGAWFNMFDQNKDERTSLWWRLGDVARQTILEANLHDLPKEVVDRFERVRNWHEQVKDTLGDPSGGGEFKVEKIEPIVFEPSGDGTSDDDALPGWLLAQVTGEKDKFSDRPQDEKGKRKNVWSSSDDDDNDYRDYDSNDF